jgi:hypothetical protein
MHSKLEGLQQHIVIDSSLQESIHYDKLLEAYEELEPNLELDYNPLFEQGFSI